MNSLYIAMLTLAFIFGDPPKIKQVQIENTIFDKNGKIFLEEKTLEKYDRYGNCVEVIEFFAGTDRPDQRRLMYYDDDFRLRQIHKIDSDGFSVWTDYFYCGPQANPCRRKVHNSNGSLITFDSIRYNDSNQEVLRISYIGTDTLKIESTWEKQYNDTGNIILEEMYYFSSFLYKAEYRYDEHNRLIDYLVTQDGLLRNVQIAYTDSGEVHHEFFTTETEGTYPTDISTYDKRKNLIKEEKISPEREIYMMVTQNYYYEDTRLMKVEKFENGKLKSITERSYEFF